MPDAPHDVHTLAPTSLDLDGLRYSLTPDTRRRVVVDVRLADPDGAKALAHVDRVDLVSHKARLRLAGELADAFGRERRQVFGHLVVLLDAAERGARAQAQATDPVELPREREARARALLASEDLLDEVALALASRGVVGEERTKRLAYLVATSRLQERPLSAILRAPSGCGKSNLLDGVEALLPGEEVLFLSRLTGQALFYAGADALAHKLVVIDEQAGASDADYALRTLQSKGSLTLRTGRGEVRVQGPISLLSGTTSSDLNPENLSRCLELVLDDSPAQTRRIQARQQAAWAGEGGERVDLERFRDAQRLLEPLAVVIPFALRLTFPARTTHDRRGSEKLLGLVAAHALLHQAQRRRDAEGRLLAEPADYAAIYALLGARAPGDAEELSPRARRAARALAERGRLSRRALAGALGWSYNTARRALDELCAQELAARCEAGPPALYRLLCADVLGPRGELCDPRELAS